jgi:hypothetical protein
MDTGKDAVTYHPQPGELRWPDPFSGPDVQRCRLRGASHERFPRPARLEDGRGCAANGRRVPAGRPIACWSPRLTGWWAVSRCWDRSWAGWDGSGNDPRHLPARRASTEPRAIRRPSMILAIRRRSAGAASAVVFCITLIAAAPAAGAQAHNDLWRIETSDDGTVVANLAMDHPRASGTVIITVMNIGFGPKDGCQPEVGVAVLKGSGYGNSVGKVSPAQTEPMSL